MYKNIIIAALATSIYHSYIVEGIPEWKVIFATVWLFVCVLAVMEAIDSTIRAARYGKPHMISHKSFEKYKRWLKEDVLQKKAKGKSETFKKDLIMNVILLQKKYAFSGKQIKELLDLATTEQKEKSA